MIDGTDMEPQQDGWPGPGEDEAVAAAGPSRPPYDDEPGGDHVHPDSPAAQEMGESQAAAERLREKEAQRKANAEAHAKAKAAGEAAQREDRERAAEAVAKRKRVDEQQAAIARQVAEGTIAQGPAEPPEAPEPPAKPAEAVSAPQTAPTEDEKDARRQTEYVILQRVAVVLDEEAATETEAWVPMGRHTGAPKGAVLREFVDGLEDPDGAYKAVAASAWKGGLNAERPTGPVFTPLED